MIVMNSTDPRDRIWVPLDVSTHTTAVMLLGQLVEAGVRNIKIGLELMTAIGAPEAVRMVKKAGCRVWLDGKFCDIPNTVSGASNAAVALGADMFNVHASCGAQAMAAAAKASVVKEEKKAVVLAVTVLTSLSVKEIWNLGYPRWPGVESFEHYYDWDLDWAYLKPLVRRMALVAHESGCDGVVCSPQELSELDQAGFNGLRVTPGVRPAWASTDDQKRVMTPAEAIKAGATALVIGRPITNPPKSIGSPRNAFRMICDEVISAT